MNTYQIYELNNERYSSIPSDPTTPCRLRIILFLSRPVYLNIWEANMMTIWWGKHFQQCSLPLQFYESRKKIWFIKSLAFPYLLKLFQLSYCLHNDLLACVFLNRKQRGLRERIGYCRSNGQITLSNDQSKNHTNINKYKNKSSTTKKFTQFV